MKNRFLWIAGAGCLVLVAIVILVRNGTGEVPKSGRNDRLGVKPVETKHTTRGSFEARQPDPVKPEVVAAKPLGPNAPQATILTEIEDASCTYDAKELPRIQPYLLHGDPEVRDAAMKGMIVLGDAKAGPLLREAAKNAPTPQEAVKLLEAADYVELPPAKLKLKKDSKKKSPAPPAPGNPPPRTPPGN